MTSALLEFEIEGAHIRLRRVDDWQYRGLVDRSNFVQDDFMFSIQLERYHRSAGLELELGQIYVALTALFGNSSVTFDNYKCSFSFLFLLGAHVGGQTFQYTLDAGDLRGGMDWRFRRVYARTDPRPRTHSADPLTDGLSRDQLNEIISWLYGYIRGYFEVTQASFQTPFYRFVPAARLVYGLEDGAFFQREFTSEKKYQAELKRLAKKIPENILEDASDTPDSIDALLETV